MSRWRWNATFPPPRKIPEFGQIAVDLLEGLGAGIEENLPQMLDDILSILDYILQTIDENRDKTV